MGVSLRSIRMQSECGGVYYVQLSAVSVSILIVYETYLAVHLLALCPMQGVGFKFSCSSLLSLPSFYPLVSCPAAPPTRGRNVWWILKRSLVLRRHIRYSWNVICVRANNNRYNYSARDRSYSSCSVNL